jgi:hypothetical protein
MGKETATSLMPEVLIQHRGALSKKASLTFIHLNIAKKFFGALALLNDVE